MGTPRLKMIPLAGAGGDAQVGLLGLAEAVDQAAEDADPQRVLQVEHLGLDLGDDPLQVDVQSSAGRAGDDLGAGDAAVAGAEDVEPGGDLGDRVSQQGDADRVADAPQNDRADACGAFERAILARAGLGDADVGRIIGLAGVLGVALHGRGHVAGLQRDDDVAIAPGPRRSRCAAGRSRPSPRGRGNRIWRSGPLPDCRS